MIVPIRLPLRDSTQTSQNPDRNLPFYVLELQLSLLEFKPSYPKQPKTLPEIIKKARMDKGLTQLELAGLISMNEQTVSNWETSGIFPQFEKARKLQEVLGLEIPPRLVYKDYPLSPRHLGERIKQKRLELHLRKIELAERLGVSLDSVADREAGRGLKNPHKRSLEKIRSFLEV